MSKRLEEILNLPEHKENVKEIEKEIRAQTREVAKQEEIEKTLKDFDKIAFALPTVEGLGAQSDREFDELAERAIKSYEDLMDLGMNVEVRYSSRIFEVASSMLSSAIEAKAAKMDKKLKIVDLQLKKLKIDNDASGRKNNEDDALDVTEYVFSDRNSLLDRLKKMDK
jgi:hypothetical protein